MKIEKFFDVVHCFEAKKKKKTSYSAFMLDNDADH